MNRVQAIQALQATGKRLAATDLSEPVTVVLAGAVAAMILGDVPESRATHDCDVVLMEPDERWDFVQKAARAIASARSLPPNWFNRDSHIYTHVLPLGWRARCEPVGTFGPLTVLSISRRDLLAMKLAGAPVRPQDLDDLITMKPTTKEIAFLEEHLDRLEAETLAGEAFDAQRAILNQLEQLR